MRSISFKSSLSRGFLVLTLCFSLYYSIAVASRLLLFVQPCQCLTLNIVCVYYYMTSRVVAWSCLCVMPILLFGASVSEGLTFRGVLSTVFILFF